MERYSIYAVDVAYVLVVGRCVSVALEAEIAACVFLLHILNCAAALDAAHSKTVCVFETGDDSGLVLEWRLHRLVEFVRGVQVDYVDIPICSADDEKFVLDVHCIYSVLVFDCCDRVL